MAKIETPRPIRGTQDMLGDSADRFAHVVETFDKVRRLYGFKRIEVPVLVLVQNRFFDFRRVEN